MRWGLIVLKGTAVPAVALGTGLLVSNYLEKLAVLDTAGVTDLARWSQWAGLVGLAAALMFYGIFVWRLWRWSEGKGPMCERCSGPLGRVRNGKVYYGRQLSDYRRCYNCGNANSIAD